MSALPLWRLAAEFATSVQVLASAGPGALPAAALRARLLALLGPLADAVARGEAAQSEVDEARFALVAWADEVILHSSGRLRDEWLGEPLQMRLYRTTRAGNEFFEHLARLRSDQPAAREVYFLVLALGFQGQYLGQEAERRAVLAQQYEALRAAGRVLETGRERWLAPAAYALEIELPRAARRGIALGIGALALAGALGLAYAALWLLLRAATSPVPLPGGG